MPVFPLGLAELCWRDVHDLYEHLNILRKEKLGDHLENITGGWRLLGWVPRF